MNNETIGQAVFVIDIQEADAQKQLKNWQTNVSDTMEKSAQETRTLSDGFADLSRSIANLATAHVALTGTASAIGDLVDSYNQYESAMNGVRAVASATGNDVTASLQAVKDVTANGLISQADAAAAVKNLQLYGYTVEQATELINIMADAAVYNRQANYSVSEAVRVTTEGIRMENSVLSDASGITKNIAKMYEEYAAQIGKTTNSLTQVEKAQAVYNGVLNEGGIFAGNAATYTESLAGSQQQLETALTSVKQSMGAVFEQFSPIISGMADFISNNEQLVAQFTLMTGVLIGGTGLIAAFRTATVAIKAIKDSLMALSTAQKVATAGFVGLAAALGSMAIYNAFNKNTEKLVDFSAALNAIEGSSQDADGSLGALGDAADDTAKKIANLNKQLSNLERNFKNSLKQIADKHEENLATLTQQIEEANVDYRRAIDERMADYDVTLAKQEKSHQETVDELMTQLNFLQRYNNQYNKEKLEKVRFALNKEQELYRRETEAQEAEIALQNQADQEKYQKRLQALQSELDEEIAFMNKHRDTLNTVRDWIVDDEVESLLRQYNEQKASYQEQIAEAGRAGTEAASAFWNNYNEQQEDGIAKAQKAMVSLAEASANLMANNIKKNQQNWIDQNFGWLGEQKTVKTGNFWKDTFGFASGGYTGRGGVNEVAGVVHRGEYVVPAEQVDQTTGQPKMGATQNITINLSGVLATSAQAKRDLAQEIMKALAQTEQARLA